MKSKFLHSFLILSALLLGACTSPLRNSAAQQTVNHVNLSSFLGKWYVISATPSIQIRKPHNLVEVYDQQINGDIFIQHIFNEGPDGEEKTVRATARIDNIQTNADWTVTYLWPLTADYKVIHLESDYSVAVIGEDSRKSARIIARSPSIPDTVYSNLMLYLQSQGYDISEMHKIPQSR